MAEKLTATEVPNGNPGIEGVIFCPKNEHDMRWDELDSGKALSFLSSNEILLQI